MIYINSLILPHIAMYKINCHACIMLKCVMLLVYLFHSVLIHPKQTTLAIICSINICMNIVNKLQQYVFHVFFSRKCMKHNIEVKEMCQVMWPKVQSNIAATEIFVSVSRWGWRG